MPVENELKYLLTEPQAVLDLPLRWKHIQQGYLPGDARVRLYTWPDDKSPSLSVFTYKIMAKKRLIEIETVLDSKDAKALWPLTTKRINKRRASITDGDVVWDLDVFFDGDTPILAMAECEMPEDMAEPPRIEPTIAPFVRWAIPREEQHLYTNVRLSDPAYARSVNE